MSTGAAGPASFLDPRRPVRLAEAFPRLDGVFARFIERHRVPGVAYGVIVDGALAHASGVGVADLDTAAVPGPTTVFRIASMTKSFTAACVLMLRDEGRVRLDDPVVHHVPELSSLRYPTTDSPAITVGQLLSMSSGLVEDDPWGDRLLDLGPADFDAVMAGGLGFDHVPGTTYEYSNLGFAVLGRLVANLAGRPLAEFAHRRLLAPLGMTSTVWDFPAVPVGAAARGYRVERGTWVPEVPLGDGAFGAMGGLATTVEDLARYVSFHLAAWPPRDDPDDGPLRRSSRREMATAHTMGPVPTADPGAQARAFGYGYGLIASTSPGLGRTVSHSGALPGFASHMEWLPDGGVGLVAMANRTYVPVWDAVREGLEELAATGALVDRVPVPSAALLDARDAVAALYERWDPTRAAGATLDTYLLDLDDDRRAPDLAELRSTLGPCVAVGDIVPTGELRGSWRMTCEGGVIDLTVMLGPTIPARIQFLTATPAPPGAA